MANEALTRPQSAKPRGRVQADGSLLITKGEKLYTRDSFENFLTKTGVGTANMASGGTYGFNPISRNRTKLEWAYRGSWIVGTIIDCVAEDMARDGIEIISDATPDEISEFEDTQIDELQLWPCTCNMVKDVRLYGGGVGLIMIDGQDVSTPFDVKTVGRDQFRGIFPLDRWSLFPTLNDLVSEQGPDLGNPKYYEVRPDYATGLPYMKIHYTRVIRGEGVRLPYWQRITENGWGQSVVERLFDRLIAFDSATQGAAQLVYKAHLRTYKVKDLRKIIALGGKALDGLTAQLDMIRKYQSSEGMTLMDAEDEFEVHPYSFEGLDDVLLQFGQQLSGASQIPLVRLFGQSPAGLNATGESDLRMYYDGVKRQQKTILGRGMKKVYHAGWRSQHGADPPEGWKLEFRSLWQLTEEQRATVASTSTDAVMKPFEAGVTARSTTLKELRSQSRVTGLFTNIDDKMIKEAETEDDGKPPSPEDLGLVPQPGAEGDNPQAPPAAKNGRGGDGIRPPTQAASQ